MSMPSFPPNGADLTREEALTMIIASIAMEELALSHIINAEGEKLQYILGTLPGAKPCAGGVSAPGAPLPLPRAVPARTACMRTLSANRAPRLRAGGMPAAGLAGERGKMCPPSGRAAGRAAMESGLPPVLAAAGPAWRVHPLECV